MWAKVWLFLFLTNLLPFIFFRNDIFCRYVPLFAAFVAFARMFFRGNTPHRQFSPIFPPLHIINIYKEGSNNERCKHFLLVLVFERLIFVLIWLSKGFLELLLHNFTSKFHLQTVKLICKANKTIGCKPQKALFWPILKKSP